MDTIIAPEDYKYIVKDPNKTFSPARNKAVINETIRETEIYFAKLGKVLDSNILNRIDILGSYGDYKLNRSGEKSFKDYAGKKLYSELIGEKILEKIRILESTNKITGSNNRMIQL